MSRITGIESIFGGQGFYDEGGNFVGYSVPGIGAGEDFYGVDGKTGYSVDSVIGNGQDYLLFRTLCAEKTGRDLQIQCSQFLMKKDEKRVKIHEAFS